MRKMKDRWPFGVALRGRLQATTCCGSGNATVVSDVEKAPVRRQAGTRKANGRNIATSSRMARISASFHAEDRANNANNANNRTKITCTSRTATAVDHHVQQSARSNRLAEFSTRTGVKDELVQIDPALRRGRGRSTLAHHDLRSPKR